MLPSDPGARHVPVVADDDWYSPDEHLRFLVRRHLGGEALRAGEAALEDLGRMVPTVIEPLAREADRHPPVLRPYAANGERIDEIDFHPAYHELMRRVLAFGVVRAAYVPGWRGLSGRAPRVLVSLMNYMLMQSDLSVTGCPVGMMDAMSRCLERNDPELAARFVPRLADDAGNHLTAAMFLTEKAGGSDVGANETVAIRQDDGTWRLHGEKWFASCPQSDLILVMARPEGSPSGTAGLGLFLVPRFEPDGTRNALILHRLKEKLGTRAMASSEAGFRGALAWPVGRLDRGMKQMLDMVNVTRVGIAVTTAASLRRSAHESLLHTDRRMTFGRRLGDHPLMRDTLADLVVDATAQLSAAVYATESAERADAGDTQAASVLRMLTPLFKLAGCERARPNASEAAEVRGGNGLIEDWPNSRLIRDIHVHATWEGPANIMALDVLRATARGHAGALLADIEQRAEASAVGGPQAALAPVVLQGLRGVERSIAALGDADPDGQQLPMRRISRRMATLATGARLLEEARDHAADTGSGRLTWIAARYLARLGGDDALAAVADDPAWLEHAEPLLRGGRVPIELGERAAHAVSAALRFDLVPVGVG